MDVFGVLVSVSAENHAKESIRMDVFAVLACVSSVK